MCRLTPFTLPQLIFGLPKGALWAFSAAFGGQSCHTCMFVTAHSMNDLCLLVVVQLALQ